MNCNGCRAECPFRCLPADAEVLRHDSCRPTPEHCGIVRIGVVVRKYIKARRNDYAKRAAIAAAHPDLFAPIEFDAAARRVEQPYIPGRHATAAETFAIAEELRRRGIDVSDIHELNIRVAPDGTPLIIDFNAVPAPPPRAVRKGRHVIVEGPLTPEILAAVGWDHIPFPGK